MTSRKLSLFGCVMKIIGTSLASVMFLAFIVSSASAGGGASKVQRIKDIKRAIQRVSPLEVISDTPDPTASAAADAKKDELYWKGRAEESTFVGDAETAKIIEALDMAIELRTEDALFALESFLEFFPKSIFTDKAAMAIEVLKEADTEEGVAGKGTAGPRGAGASDAEASKAGEEAVVKESAEPPRGESAPGEDDGTWTVIEEPVPRPGAIAAEPSAGADGADDVGDWTVIEPSTVSDEDEMKFEMDEGDEEGYFDDEGE